MIKLEYNNKLFNILDNYSFKKSSREVTFNPVTIDFTGKSINDLPCKYQECKIWDLLSYNEEKSKTYQGKELNFNLPVSKVVNVTEFKIDGKSVQNGTPTPDTPIEIESVSGIENLLKISNTDKTINGVTFTKNSDDTITVNGTATATTIYNLLENSSLILEKGTYILSGCPNGGSDSTYKLDIPAGSYPTDYGTNVKVIINEETTYNSMRIVIYSGVTLNNVIFKPMLSRTTADYVPYGHWLTITNTGKNLFDKDNVNKLSAYVNTSEPYTIISNTSNRILFVKAQPNTNYTISKIKSATFNVASSVEMPDIGVVCTNFSNVGKVADDGRYYITLRTGNNDNYIIVRYFQSALDTTITEQEILDSIQIEKGTEPTKYKPYQRTSSLVDMNKYDSDGNINGYYELSSQGSIKDELNIDKDGNTSITQNIGEVVLDGSDDESWDTSGAAVGSGLKSYRLVGFVNTYNGKNESDAMLDHFSYGNWGNATIQNSYIISNNLYIRINQNLAPDLTSLKSWLSANNVTVKYILAEPKTVRLNKCIILLHDGVNNISLNNTLDTNLLLSTHQDFLLNGSILYTGYVNSTKLPNMKNEGENRYLELELLSPMALATRRTITAVGAYKLRELINLIIKPLITDGFTLKEMNIGNNTVTVNYLVETVESALNKLSNKFNFWWYIDENKQITINDITYQFQKTPIQVWNDKNKFEKLISVTPSIEAIDYCNVIDFTNVRVYQYSYYGTFTHKIYDDSGEVIKSTTYDLNKDKLFDVTKTIKKDDAITFDFPIDIKPENIIKSLNANSEEILSELNYYAFSMSYKRADGTNGTIYIKTDSSGTPVTYSNNVSLSESDNEKEFVFSRDSFFSNLLTGFKYNGTSNIISISQLFSCSALIWTRLKINNGEEIQRVKGHISESGQVEKIVDMNEQWKTFTELQKTASSYINASSNQANTIELEIDKKNGYEVGDIISIYKPGFLLKGNYMVTDLEKTSNGKEYNRQVLTLRNSDYLTSYIDLFRANEEQTSDDKVYNLTTINYNENRIKEVHEVV